ncbi:MAG: Gfo/Idh/MocA family protein [Methanobacteriota archaeon]
MLRVAVIGLGAMGVNHARVWRDLGCELVAVCDADPTRAKMAGERFRARAETDPEKLLSRDDVDAVCIATPTVTHADVAKRAFAAGKHALVEKPLAADVRTAREIVAAAKKAGKNLAVGHIERHNPAVAAAHDLVARGEIGTLHTALARRVNRPDVSGRITDVGVILDLAIHDIDVLRYLSGSDPETVYAATATDGTRAHEGRSVVQLGFPGGLVGILETSRLTPLKVRSLTLTGSEGALTVDYVEQAISVSRSRALPYDEAQMFQLPLEYDHRNFRIQKQEPLARELADFRDSIEKGRPPLVRGEDGVANLAVAEAALRSARDGVPVRLREVLHG